MAPSAHVTWVEGLADEAVKAVNSLASYRQRRTHLLLYLSGTSRDYTALRDAAFLCRQRARRRAQPLQSQAEAVTLAHMHHEAAELLEYISLDLRAESYRSE